MLINMKRPFAKKTSDMDYEDLNDVATILKTAQEKFHALSTLCEQAKKALKELDKIQSTYEKNNKPLDKATLARMGNYNHLIDNIYNDCNSKDASNSWYSNLKNVSTMYVGPLKKEDN